MLSVMCARLRVARFWGSARQVVVGTNIFFKGHMPAPEGRAADKLRACDAIHAEVPEIFARRIPCDKIPERLQDEHGLRLDIAQAARAFGIPILKAEVLARQKGFFKSGQQGGVDCAQVRQVLFGRELADVQAGEEAAQIAHFVRRQGALDLGEACICEIGEGQVLGGAHGGHADQQREDFGHREAGGCLHGLGVKLHATAAPAFGMDDKAFVTQGGDVAQERASGGADLFGELRDG